MTELFFCTAPQSEERERIATKMASHWLALGVKFQRLTPRLLGCSDFDFQSLRRSCAEILAKEPFYLLVDDDVELTEGTIAQGLEILRREAQFGILSAMPTNATITRWTPDTYDAYHDQLVTEHHSVGGLRFIRRGSMFKGWPEQTARGYDLEHCQAMRDCGYRVGYMYDIKMFHHGEGKAETWAKSSLPVAKATSAKS